MNTPSLRDPIASLPRLAFGEAGAWTSKNYRLAEEKVAMRLSSLEGYEPDGNVNDFGIKLSHLNINGLILTAQSSSPTKLRMGASYDLHLVIPLVGGAESITADHRSVWRAGETAALFAAEGSFSGISERKSTIAAKLDPARCQKILDAMWPQPNPFNISALFRTRLLDLRRGQLDFTFIKIFINEAS